MTLSLSGCHSTPVEVNNNCPPPHFLKCDTVQWLAENDAPENVVNDLVWSTNVNLKLREEQPNDQRLRFGSCQLPDNNSAD